MKKNNRIKQAYREILEVCEKHSSLRGKDSNFGDISDMISAAKNRLLVEEWSDKYGIELDRGLKPFSRNYMELSGYTAFSYYDDAEKEKEQGSGRYISWSDDDRQPKDEWLFKISFPTGAYIFGEDYDYQKPLFIRFFKELKSYKPDYVDTANKSLYWKLQNAKGIYKEFDTILRKYGEINKSELDNRKIQKLKKEIERLENRGTKLKT